MTSQIPQSDLETCKDLLPLCPSFPLTGFQRVQVTNQVLIFSCQNFQTVQHVLNITAFYMRMYRPGQRQSSFILLCILFGVIHFVDATNGSI